MTIQMAKLKRRTCMRTAETLEFFDGAYALDHGPIVRSGPSSEVAVDPASRDAYMGL